MIMQREMTDMPPTIPFNKPHMTGKELWYISQAHHNGMLAGDGAFTRKCNNWLENKIRCRKALLTHSCTCALEMAAILADIGPGDEVIMPSYTFVSTANAFVLRGGVPVFVDIRPDTLNLDETKLESAITARTKAIVPVHYAGVGCEMDAILSIAQKHNLLVIEDAAQGIMASYRNRPLGAIGHMAALSFHETKNVISGEGGALLINDERFIERAEIIREKGTNRNQFFRGQTAKYTWVDIGSSYLPGELTAAFLYAQMEEAESITERRHTIWNQYHHHFSYLEARGYVQRPHIPTYCQHNAHMYYLRVKDLDTRTLLLKHLNDHGIGAVFHYIPLHSSPAGRRYGRCHGDMKITDSVADRIIRLPLFYSLSEAETIAEQVSRFFIQIHGEGM
jgi:dTDP-4-amino-4,6-dideoxygalactose transaminase